MSIKKIISTICLLSITTTSIYADKYYISPFNSPNTSISISQPTITETLKSELLEVQSTPNVGNFSYKFQFEFPVKKWFNLGFFFENTVGKGKWTYTKGFLNIKNFVKYSNILGFYGKLQYSPLPDDKPYLNFVSKLNCGFGPKILGPSGVIFRTSAEFGIESYFNEWFGVFATYGYIFEIGKETLLASILSANNSEPMDTEDELFKGISMHATGNEIIFGLTTTFL